MTEPTGGRVDRRWRRIALLVALFVVAATVLVAVMYAVRTLFHPAEPPDERLLNAAITSVGPLVGTVIGTVFARRRLGGARNYSALQEALKKKRLPDDRGDIDWPDLFDRQLRLLRLVLALIRMLCLVIAGAVLVFALLRPGYTDVTWLLLGTTALLAVVMELFGWWARHRVLRLRAQLDA